MNNLDLIFYIISLVVLSFILGFLYRLLFRKMAKGTNSGSKKNIGIRDRLLRVTIGIIVFIFAMKANWNPILILIAGFCFFEAVFSWCAVYAAIGKNSCPV